MTSTSYSSAADWEGTRLNATAGIMSNSPNLAHLSIHEQRFACVADGGWPNCLVLATALRYRCLREPKIPFLSVVGFQHLELYRFTSQLAGLHGQCHPRAGLLDAVGQRLMGLRPASKLQPGKSDIVEDLYFLLV